MDKHFLSIYYVWESLGVESMKVEGQAWPREAPLGGTMELPLGVRALESDQEASVRSPGTCVMWHCSASLSLGFPGSDEGGRDNTSVCRLSGHT